MTENINNQTTSLDEVHREKKLSPLVCEGYRKSLVEDMLAIRKLNSDKKQVLLESLVELEKNDDGCMYDIEEDTHKQKRDFWRFNKKAEKEGDIDDDFLTKHEIEKRNRKMQEFAAIVCMDIKKVEAIWNGYFGKGDRYDMRGIGFSGLVSAVKLMIEKNSVYTNKPTIQSGFTQEQMEFFEEIFSDRLKKQNGSIYVLLDQMFDREKIV